MSNHRSNEEERITLAEGCAALGLTREQGIRAIITGAIHGWHDAARSMTEGRWFFSPDAVRRQLALKELASLPTEDLTRLMRRRGGAVVSGGA
jgi:hypothetical protein